MYQIDVVTFRTSLQTKLTIVIYNFKVYSNYIIHNYNKQVWQAVG